MIHIVTAANCSLYRDQLREMHRQRWLYYVEQRGWSDLGKQQQESGYEYDAFDDARAVYLLVLAEDGGVQGAMRLRPTDDKSLLFDHFPQLVAPESGAKPGPQTWEITRLMRSPECRGSDGALRLSINCAACEFCLSRGIERLVAVIDTFLLPPAQALHRNKQRVLGPSHKYAEGEMIALEVTPDAEWLAMGRSFAHLDQPLMFEAPAPAPGGLAPLAEAELSASVRRLPPQRLAALRAWLSSDSQSFETAA
jgi:N-acyl-L-homoserine lactone synthetase